MKTLLRLLHIHHWRITVYNSCLTAVEQRCRCGAYRWHGWKHREAIGEQPSWQPGKHPNYGEDYRRRLNRAHYALLRSCGSSDKEARSMTPEPEYLA